ncbi:dUTP diphosphatase [uncultured Sphaerochaeta sp.]|uniref:dUTP diphosphatase n=1 Tax=uncultured Sphaerochaeta sp. TaxID=886478 RepID=UPI002A0A5353|nr:dUTP diphosphatase [uncultured Sphaerochaeta sp.]
MAQRAIEISITLQAGAKAPAYATAYSAGADICALLSQDLVIESGSFSMVPTGLNIALPKGYEAQVRPRSGLAAKYGVTVLNSPGTIDADYRGEVKVILINHGKKPFVVHDGDRIAQLVITSYAEASFNLVESLDETERGQGGFGSTGV